MMKDDFSRKAAKLERGYRHEIDLYRRLRADIRLYWAHFGVRVCLTWLKNQGSTRLEP